MKLAKKVLITIGRQYGSGGHAVASEISKDLDIPLFDKNMLTMIAKKHGYDENVLTSEDERLSNPFFEPYVPYGIETGALSERLFTMQSQIIREEADKGSAIFVGRCADDVLKDYGDVVNIFIYAPRADRVKRVMESENIEDSLAADKIIKRIDKTRISYYQFYTDRKWGTTDGMSLMINSSELGIEGTARLIESYLQIKGYIE